MSRPRNIGQYPAVGVPLEPPIKGLTARAPVQKEQRAMSPGWVIYPLRYHCPAGSHCPIQAGNHGKGAEDQPAKLGIESTTLVLAI